MTTEEEDHVSVMVSPGTVPPCAAASLPRGRVRQGKNSRSAPQKRGRSLQRAAVRQCHVATQGLLKQAPFLQNADLPASIPFEPQPHHLRKLDCEHQNTKFTNKPLAVLDAAVDGNACALVAPELVCGEAVEGAASTLQACGEDAFKMLESRLDYMIKYLGMDQTGVIAPRVREAIFLKVRKTMKWKEAERLPQAFKDKIVDFDNFMEGLFRG